jgi:hypothetical protein
MRDYPTARKKAMVAPDSIVQACDWLEHAYRQQGAPIRVTRRCFASSIFRCDALRDAAARCVPSDKSANIILALAGH